MQVDLYPFGIYFEGKLKLIYNDTWQMKQIQSQHLKFQRKSEIISLIRKNVWDGMEMSEN